MYVFPKLLLKNVCISQIAVFHISCEMLFVRYDKVTIMLLHGNGRHLNYTLLLAPSIMPPSKATVSRQTSAVENEFTFWGPLLKQDMAHLALYKSKFKV